MAGDGGNRGRGVVRGIPKEVQAKLGILVVSPEQCALDTLGAA